MQMAGTSIFRTRFGRPVMAPALLAFLSLGAFLSPGAFLRLADTAQAQSPVCGQIRAELAQLPAGRGGGGSATRESMRLRSELGRIQQAIQQNDCNRSGFILFNQPPAVCGPLKAQAGQYAAQIRQIEGGGGNDPASARRAQLISALDRYGCNSPQQAAPGRSGVIYAAPEQPGLMDRLFGNTSVDGRVEPGPDARPQEEAEAPKERLGGRTAVCVRTCDGYFFPVNFEGIGARDEYSQVCQSLCPAADTQVYFMPLGGDIERAAARDGTPYTSLPAAKKFQTSRDPACVCKPPQQTWYNATKGFEDLVEARKGDIVVSKEQALAMSRPKGLQAPNDPKAKGKKGQPLAPVIDDPAALPDNQLPTGGNASSGIGPKIRNEAAPDPDADKRLIRNVAPGLVVRDNASGLRGAKAP